MCKNDEQLLFNFYKLVNIISFQKYYELYEYLYV